MLQMKLEERNFKKVNQSNIFKIIIMVAYLRFQYFAAEYVFFQYYILHCNGIFHLIFKKYKTSYDELGYEPDNDNNKELASSFTAKIKCKNEFERILFSNIHDVLVDCDICIDDHMLYGEVFGTSFSEIESSKAMFNRCLDSLLNIENDPNEVNVFLRKHSIEDAEQSVSNSSPGRRAKRRREEEPLI